MTDKPEEPEQHEEHGTTVSADGRYEIRFTQWRRIRFAPYELWEADVRWQVVAVAAGAVLASYAGTWGDTPEPGREMTGTIDVRFDGAGYVVKRDQDTYEHHELPDYAIRDDTRHDNAYDYDSIDSAFAVVHLATHVVVETIVGRYAEYPPDHHVQQEGARAVEIRDGELVVTGWDDAVARAPLPVRALVSGDTVAFGYADGRTVSRRRAR